MLLLKHQYKQLIIAIYDTPANTHDQILINI